MLKDRTVDDAIARLPGQSNAQVRTVLKNAQQRDAQRLVDACEQELKLRGPAALDADKARQAVEHARLVEGKGLEDVIAIAFTEVPFSDYELRLLRIMAEKGRARFSEILKAYGKGDLALVGGHLVYDRFGFFRHLLDGLPDQSSLLMLKGKDEGQVTWALRPEAEAVFQRLGVFS
jgi:hypothetical protein